MHLEQTIDVAAPPDRVWEVMSNVERWHEWTPTITSVERLDSGPFGLGSRARVVQPRLRPAIFEVTGFAPGRSFTWATRSGGLAAVADHEVTPLVDGSRVKLALDFSGWPLLVLGWWVRRLSTRYMTIEAEGLKRRAES
jgi:hypothetical protein